jgi:hypothetical protein
MRGTLKYSRELFWHYWIPVLVMLSLIGLESTDTMSGHNTFHLLSWLTQALGLSLSQGHLQLANLVMRKGGHTVGYGLLCLSWLLLLRGTSWLRHDYKRAQRDSMQAWKMWWRPEWAALAALLTFSVATADELHQMSIPSRSGSWWDVALDTCAGLIVLSLINLRARSRCRHSQTA